MNPPDPYCKHCGEALEFFRLTLDDGRLGRVIALWFEHPDEDDLGEVTIDDDGFAIRHPSASAAQSWLAHNDPEGRTRLEHRCQRAESWDGHFIAQEESVRVIGRDD